MPEGTMEAPPSLGGKGEKIVIPEFNNSRAEIRRNQATDCGRGLEIDLTWHWQQHPGSLMDALHDIDDDVHGGSTPAGGKTWDQVEFERIADEQRHSPPVQHAYERCHQSDPNAFWEGVAAAAWGVREGQHYDMPGIAANLDWQWRNNRGSIKDAQDKNTDPNRSFGRAIGMHYVLHGQRHNPAIQWAYRAAFRDHPDEFWAIVNSFR